MHDIIPQRGSLRPSSRVRPVTRSSAPVVRRPVTVRGEPRARPSLDTIKAAPVPAEAAKKPNKARINHRLAQSAVKADIIERAVAASRAKAPAKAKAERSKPKKTSLFTPSRIVFGALIFVVLAVTGYVSVDTWLTNNRVKATQTDTGQVASAEVNYEDQEGTDKVKPSPELLSKYAVAGDLPRALYIDKINVAARVLPMGVNKSSSVQAPINVYDSGWYTGSVKPGEIGAMFIDGHASGATREGLFGYLDTLVEGDTIQIEKGDGTKLTYKVVHTETVDVDKVDMKKALLPHGNALRGLNLMTCTGDWIDGGETYDKRVLVYTEQI